MKDREGAKKLDKEKPVQDFDYYVDKYGKDGYKDKKLWSKIIGSSKKTKSEVNKKYGTKSNNE